MLFAYDIRHIFSWPGSYISEQNFSSLHIFLACTDWIFAFETNKILAVAWSVYCLFISVINNLPRSCVVMSTHYWCLGSFSVNYIWLWCYLRAFKSQPVNILQCHLQQSLFLARGWKLKMNYGTEQYTIILLHEYLSGYSVIVHDMLLKCLEAELIISILVLFVSKLIVVVRLCPAKNNNVWLLIAIVTQLTTCMSSDAQKSVVSHIQTSAC